MKKILLFLIVVFFATQIIPVKYVGYLCDSEVLASSNDGDDFSEEDNLIKSNEKLDAEFESQIELYNNYTIAAFKSVNSKFPSHCCYLPNDYVCNVIVPPPNNTLV